MPRAEKDKPHLLTTATTNKVRFVAALLYYILISACVASQAQTIKLEALRPDASHLLNCVLHIYGLDHKPSPARKKTILNR